MFLQKIHLATRQLGFSPNLGLLLKRMKSGGKCSDACCGVRQDCKLRPCKDTKKDCCYATCGRPDCIPFKFPEKSAVCEKNPCFFYPRFDWLYYRRSDKAERQYQKTWCDCPPSIQTRCVLCGEIPEFPPMQKREPSKECRLPTACEKHKGKFEMLCKKASKSKCPYLEAPCCEIGRRPPKCTKVNKNEPCEKICCPYPAYSECCVMGFAKLPHRAWQCFCLEPPAMCIVNRELQKQRLLKK